MARNLKVPYERMFHGASHHLSYPRAEASGDRHSVLPLKSDPHQEPPPYFFNVFCFSASPTNFLPITISPFLPLTPSTYRLLTLSRSPLSSSICTTFSPMKGKESEPSGFKRKPFSMCTRHRSVAVSTGLLNRGYLSCLDNDWLLFPTDQKRWLHMRGTYAPLLCFGSIRQKSEDKRYFPFDRYICSIAARF